MEARHIRAAILAALLTVLMGASYRTPNYVIQTADPQLAELFGKAAEKYRHDLAIEWTGAAMPNWSQPCVVTVNVGPNLGAGGATTFMFEHGEVYGWRMNIQGSAERVLDSVLPHEITHTIFATHFGRPLPRWADEGGATTVEHQSERAKHKGKLIEYLRTNRGIAFNQMFAMTEYPPDIMPLYAQGYSLAEFLIQQGGRREYVNYLGDGMQSGDWNGSTERHYGMADLGVLQTTWVAWVAKGSPALRPRETPANAAPGGPLLAESGKLPRPEPNLIYRTAATGRTGASGGAPAASGGELSVDGWHAAAGSMPTSSVAESDPPAAQAVHTEAARPQPVQGPGQMAVGPYYR